MLSTLSCSSCRGEPTAALFASAFAALTSSASSMPNRAISSLSSIISLSKTSTWRTTSTCRSLCIAASTSKSWRRTNSARSFTLTFNSSGKPTIALISMSMHSITCA